MNDMVGLRGYIVVGVGVVLFGVALLISRRQAGPAAEPAEQRLVPAWCRLDTLCLIVVVVAALAVRVWRLGTVPEGLWFDESQRGLEVLRMLAERGLHALRLTGTELG